MSVFYHSCCYLYCFAIPPRNQKGKYYIFGQFGRYDPNLPRSECSSGAHPMQSKASCSTDNWIWFRQIFELFLSICKHVIRVKSFEHRLKYEPYLRGLQTMNPLIARPLSRSPNCMVLIELRLFGANVFPLLVLILLMSHINIVAVGKTTCLSMTQFWAENWTNHLPNAGRMRYLLRYRRGFSKRYR